MGLSNVLEVIYFDIEVSGGDFISSLRSQKISNLKLHFQLLCTSDPFISESSIINKLKELFRVFFHEVVNHLFVRWVKKAKYL